MISCKRHLWVGGMLAATLLYVPMTYGQLGNLLDQGKNAAAGGGLDNLGGMGNGLSLDSLSSGSTGNVAGVLEYWSTASRTTISEAAHRRSRTGS
jgi:hypothetical protein